MIAGLILAAGASTRFGEEPKLLSELEGRPLLEHAIRAQCAVSTLERVVVVLGAHAHELVSHVDLLRAEAVICHDWAAGLSQSLRAGTAALEGAQKVLVTLGDQPLITPQAIARLAAEPAGTRAAYHGRPGHPVVLGPEHIRALGTVRGDRGAGVLLGSAGTVECSNLGSDRDVDTRADLEAVRHRPVAALGREQAWVGGRDAVDPEPAQRFDRRALVHGPRV